MKRTYIRDGRAPVPKDERVSRTMSAICAKNTKPELLVRKILSSAKLKGYRLHLKQIPGRPDIGFLKKKTAIFIHGCFWHGCPYCKPKLPKTHRSFWHEKISDNKLRDARKIKELRQIGWYPLTIWECRLKSDKGRAFVLQRIQTAVK